MEIDVNVEESPRAVVNGQNVISVAAVDGDFGERRKQPLFENGSGHHQLQVIDPANSDPL